ncbi:MULTISPECIES: DUF5674 family protein [unclassified Microcoleus]|uniref:DUF5674 family protein n=2 Tax=unclassified Microcoleus TaxID=2642155 RepID=UPI0025DB3287|nr:MULTISPECIES: DUF5674 family protein [unclassified Microcoleus]
MKNHIKSQAYSGMIYLIQQCATQEQIEEMLEILGSYIKLAVDIERRILTGGGELHADCEALLLENGSKQVDIWGADWYPLTQEVGYESLINIRPRQNNRSMEIQDPVIRERVAQIVQQLLGGL